MSSPQSNDGVLPAVSLPGGRSVPEYALLERAATSGGPGGQHANRTASSIELRVVAEALPISQEEMNRLRANAGRRLRSDGTIAVRSSDSRSQLANRKQARMRLERLLTDLLRTDAVRVPTRVSRGAVRRGAEQKRLTSARKAARKRPGLDED